MVDRCMYYSGIVIEGWDASGPCGSPLGRPLAPCNNGKGSTVPKVPGTRTWYSYA